MRTYESPRALLRQLFDAALAAVDPLHAVQAHLPPRPAGRVIVIGAGKAAARMAQGVEQQWEGPLEGLVVTRYDHGAPTRHIEVLEAGHPVPDEASAQAAERMLALVRGLGPDDLVLCLMSGGASALLSLPAPGITLDEKRAIHRRLLASGAPIGEMNCVRRHLSAIKGGRLALACQPARVLTLAVSDVPGDDPAIIGSGPTVPAPGGGAEALAILARYGIDASPAVHAVLADPALAPPGPDAPRLQRNQAIVIASAQHALEAAAAAARGAGLACVILSDRMEGEAREVGVAHAALARQVRIHGRPAGAPCVILSGGETTVTLRGGGRGGRNTEFLLSLALALQGMDGVHAIACDTDGIDGSEDNAGALIGPATLALATAAGLDARAVLDDNDAYRLFARLDDLVVTGPTRTNVNDFRAILVE